MSLKPDMRIELELQWVSPHFAADLAFRGVPPLVLDHLILPQELLEDPLVVPHQSIVIGKTICRRIAVLGWVFLPEATLKAEP